MAKAIRRLAIQRRRRRALLAAGAGAGLCMAVTAVSLVSSREPAFRPTSVRGVPASSFVVARVDGATVLRAGGSSRTLAPGTSWRAGDWLRSEGGAVEVEGGDGTSVTLSPSSELQLVRADAERRLHLTTGSVSVHVAKLKAGERFVVVTPDAEVEVRGTRFEVDIVAPQQACGGGTVTRVSVTEGVVEVRGAAGDVRVPAGDRWPAACDGPAPLRVSQAAAPPSTPSATRTRVHSRALSSASRVAPAPVEARRSSSTLATENDLFSSALRAEHDGNGREAIELLDILLTRFPASSLCPTAASVRDRLSQSVPPAL